jgi:glyoxylase-like metal-dependent hydrolase (beta-lactamase superfamily II)
MFLPPRFGWPLNVGVVRSGGRTVLIDAGLGAEYPEFAGAGQLTRRLEAAGLGLESLTDVVLTHMHQDHIGGLLGLRDRLRPDLRIHVSATEAEFWAGKADLSRATMPPGVPESLRSIAKRFLDEYHGRLQPFEKEHEVAPGVLVRRTGGHTPGHSVVRLESGGDRLMFGGDSVFPPGFELPPLAQTASTPSPRRRSASGSVSCGSSRRPASRWWPLTCRSRPPAGWR